MLSFNAKLLNLKLCDFHVHTSKAPGMCAYYIARGELLDFEPYFSSGVVESTLPPGFSLAIATDINRSTPYSLTFKLCY